jgi:hypothetical protein
MTRLLFGEPAKDRPAGIRVDGSLDRVLRKVLPLPLANPGINYV